MKGHCRNRERSVPSIRLRQLSHDFPATVHHLEGRGAKKTEIVSLKVQLFATVERERENSKTLFYNGCSLGSVKNLSNN